MLEHPLTPRQLNGVFANRRGGQFPTSRRLSPHESVDVAGREATIRLRVELAADDRGQVRIQGPGQRFLASRTDFMPAR